MHPLLAAFLAVVFWGVSFVASKAVLATLSPTVLIFTRFALGALVLLAISAARKQPLIPPRNTWPMLALMGFIGVFVHQMLQLHGLVHTTAVNAGWLVGLVPIWSAILAALFLRERFGPFKLAGLALGFAGATLVVTHGQISTETLALPSTLGDILVLASTLNWAVYTHRRPPHHPASGQPAGDLGGDVFGLADAHPLLSPLRRLARTARPRRDRLALRPLPRDLLLGIGLSLLVSRPRVCGNQWRP